MNELERTSRRQSAGLAAAEVLLIFLVFFIAAGSPVPNVNEAHYLAKAKHYWQPRWCSGDLFLESGEAHLLFYWTLGWLNLLMSLPAVAWVGRLVIWGGLAGAWQRLSWAVVPRPMMSVWTASLFLLFNQRFHMAGEWVVGGVEAKGLAYVFVLLALEAMVRSHWRRVWILLGLATSMHVLVGGWSWLAAGVAWLACGRVRPPLRSMLPAMALGILLALPGLVAALALGRGVSPETAAQANDIYVYGRLAHHLVFHRFSHEFMARHALLLALWITVCCLSPCRLSSCASWPRPLRGFVGGAVLLALIGIAIDQSLLYHLDISAALLKYYWFRMSDAFLPVGVALALAGLVDRWWTPRPRAAQWLLLALAMVAAADLVRSNHERRLDFRPGADLQTLPSWPADPERTRAKYEDWRSVCAWIADNTPPEAVFITPRSQQTFKWYAQRPEVCAWKDVPQDPASVVRWWQRQQEIYPRAVLRNGLAVHGEERLVELAQRYGAQYVLVDRDASPRRLMLPRVFPDSLATRNSYDLYRVPAPPSGVDKARETASP